MLEKIKTNIKSILFSKQFKRFAVLGFFSFAIFSLWIDVTFASDTKMESDPAKAITDILKGLQYIAWISWALIWWLTWIITILLDPSWINWTMFSMSDYLRQVWIFVSNIVYFAFAGILIAISFMNIIWKWTWDVFELKKALPKFVVWVLIVPLSWFLVQFVVSMASILTVSVYAWPIETFEPKLDKMTWTIEWCDSWVLNIQWKLVTAKADATKWTEDDPKNKWFFYCEFLSKAKPIKDVLFKKVGDEYKVGGLLWVYTFWVMDVGSLDEISEKKLSDIKTIFQLSAKVLFDIVFVLVYLVILIALFLALFVRVIVLWIYMMLSPVFWLLYFSSKWLWKFSEKFNIKEFFALAMVPVYVAAALSFWMMFLLIIWEGASKTGFTSGNWVKVKWGEKFDIWSTSITIKWSTGDYWWANFLKGIGWWALWALWYIFMKLFGLAFLWMAVMAALKSSTITWNIIKPIEDFWTQVWKFAMESPKYMPIPGTKGLSFGWGMDLWKNVMRKMEQNQSDKARKWWEDHLSFMGTDESKKLTKDISEATWKWVDNALEKVKNIFRNYTADSLLWRKDDIAKILEEAKVDGADSLKWVNKKEELYKVLTEINNKNMNLKWWPLLWRSMTNEADTASVLWSKAWTTWDSKTPANQTVNIRYDVQWVAIDQTKWIVNIDDENKFTESLKNQLSKTKWIMTVEDLRQELITKFWADDKDKIDNIIKNLEVLKDDKGNPIKLFKEPEKKEDKSKAATTNPPANTTV